jgi:hypothetical protein
MRTPTELEFTGSDRKSRVISSVPCWFAQCSVRSIASEEASRGLLRARARLKGARVERPSELKTGRELRYGQITGPSAEFSFACP